MTGAVPVGDFPRYPTSPPTPAVVRPPLVGVLFSMLVAQAALEIVGFVVLASTHEVRHLLETGAARQTIPRDQPIPTHDLDVIASVVDWAFGAVVGASTVFFLLLAFKVRAGRRWAWIVQLVFAILGLQGVVSAVTVVGSPLNPASRVIAVLGAPVDIAILVLLLVRPTRDFIAASRAPRHGRPGPSR